MAGSNLARDPTRTQPIRHVRTQNNRREKTQELSMVGVTRFLVYRRSCWMHA